MRIILVGGGGREHALAWAISDSPLCDELIVTPGNPGTQAYGGRANIAAEDIELVHLAQTEQADIVVIGPEVPLVEGLADRLEAVGIRSFGPSAAAARLEGSKRFARDFCKRHYIPNNPQFDYFSTVEPARICHQPVRRRSG